MKGRKFPLLPVLGISLVLLGLAGLVAFTVCVRTGARRDREILTQMETLLPERSDGVPGSYSNPHMPSLEIGGTDCAALLEIPALNVALPVAADWENRSLWDPPARFSGSTYGPPMVIGGSDFAHQFSFCDRIENGTAVTVTDMTGARFSYTVTGVERSNSASVEWLLDEDADLTLFCRDLYSMEYLAVRCCYSYRWE